MNVRVKGTFVMKDSYHGFVDEVTGDSLNSVLSSAFQKGAVVSLSFESEYVMTKDLCKERTKYSICGEILDDDGNCPSPQSHVPQTAEEAA